MLFHLIVDTKLHFPEPIGDITPFDIAGFFFVAELLANMVNNIASRGGDDT